MAREAAAQFALDRVTMIPNGNPPHKQGVERVDWEPSRLEEGRARSYSIHTIEIRTWHRREEVLAAVEFIVVSRPGVDLL